MKTIEILKTLKLGTTFTFQENLESNITTAWGVDWDELFIARDILQNFYDANKSDVDKIKIENSGMAMTISAPSSFNIKRLFYLGSEKGNDDVGKYGEGFKAACVCLLRDFKVNPIAVSEDKIYFIRLAEKPVEGTQMYPLVYESFLTDSPIVGTKLILQNCTPTLIEKLSEGLMNFFFTENHPIIGEYIARSAKGTVNVYKSKDEEGYIYFDKILRAKLGKELPIVLSFTHNYVSIVKKIGKDRDRRTFTKSDNLAVFFDEMWFNAYYAKKILEATKATSWAKGHGHELFKKLEYCNSSYNDIFKDDYYAKSSSDDLLESKTIKEKEAEWKEAGRIALPNYFERFGLVSGASLIKEYKKRAAEESKNAVQRFPTQNESKGIDLMREIMKLFAPETSNIFDKQKTIYTIIESDILLGEFKGSRSYRSREVFLSASLFTASFGHMVAVFLHEHSHIYGYDGSRNFTDALTSLLEKFVAFRDILDEFEVHWNGFVKLVEQERNSQTSSRENYLNVIDKLDHLALKTLLKTLPKGIVEAALAGRSEKD